MYVIDWLHKQALHRPDKVALIDIATGRSITYRQFDERASRFAEYLSERCGFKEGERIAVLAHNSSDYLEMMYGCAKAGVIMVCLNWRLPASELIPVMEDSAPRMLVFGEEFKTTAQAIVDKMPLQHRLLVGGKDSAVLDYEACLSQSSGKIIEMPCRAMDAVWQLLYTSGTTGKPKGVIQTYGMVFFNAVSTSLAINLSADDVLLSVLPFFHTGGLNLYTNPAIHIGATTYVMKQFDPEKTIELLDSNISVFLGVPAIYQFISQHPRFAQATFTQMRSWSAGGSPAPKSLWETYLAKGIAVRGGFGMTETSPTVFLCDEETSRKKIGCLGKPVTSMLTRIVDTKGKDLGPNERGELLIKGPGVTPGYWNMPQATAAAIQDGWLHSGDIAYYDDDGDYYVVDRAKDMFISGGENVYPAEVENVISQIPEVAEVAVIGTPDQKWGEVGTAVVVPRAGNTLDADAVVAFCRGRLANYKVPKHITIVSALPRTPAGKVEKQKLRAQFAATSKI